MTNVQRNPRLSRQKFLSWNYDPAAREWQAESRIRHHGKPAVWCVSVIEDGPSIGYFRLSHPKYPQFIERDYVGLRLAMREAQAEENAANRSGPLEPFSIGSHSPEPWEALADDLYFLGGAGLPDFHRNVPTIGGSAPVDPLAEGYATALDMAVHLKQMLIERDGPSHRAA